MSRPNRQPLNPSTATSPRLVIKRIRFLERSISGEKIRRRFTDPRICLAIEETAGLSELPTETPDSDAVDHIVAVCVHPEAESEWESIGASWLTPREHGDAAQVASVKWNGVAISWLPGRAVIIARGDGREDALAALTDFAFHEAELRRLEQSLQEKERGADADVVRAHRVRFQDRKHWQRIAETTQHLAQLRLTFAKLRPKLIKAPRSLNPNARRLIARLFHAADVTARLQSLDGRLETCQRMYEAANDRIARFRWHLTGWLLQSGILALLFVGVLLIAAGLCAR